MRPAGSRNRISGAIDPDRRYGGAGAFDEHARQPRQDFLIGISARHPMREPSQRFVGRRSAPVDQLVGPSLDPLPHRLKGDRDQRRRDDRERQVELPTRTNKGADPHYDADIDDRDKRGKSAVNERAVDDQVDLIEPVLEDGDRNRSGDGQQHDGDDQIVERQLGLEDRHKALHCREQAHEGDRGNEPFQLQPLLGTGSPVPHNQGGERRNHGQEQKRTRNCL